MTSPVLPRMRIAALAVSLLLTALSSIAAEPAKMTIEAQPLGDAPDGVATRVTFRFPIPQEVPPGVPLVITGSVTESGTVVKRFRYPLDPSRPDSLKAVMALPPGSADIEARLIVPLEEDTPVI